MSLAFLGAIGFTLGALMLVTLGLPFSYPSSATAGAFVGAVSGTSLGVAFQDWRTMGFLAVAGAMGFGIGSLAIELLATGPAGTLLTLIMGAIGGASLGAALEVTRSAVRDSRREPVFRLVAWAGVILLGSAVLIVGVSSLMFTLPYAIYSMNACNEEEQAVYEQFPQYGGLHKKPEPFADTGGCAVFYDTQDSPEQVSAYFSRQLKEHGWTVDRKLKAGGKAAEQFEGTLVRAHRGTYIYEVGYESHEFYDPPRPGTHVALHVWKRE